jgi:hypothetical protein
MNERLVPGIMMCVFMLCEKVEGRGSWGDESDNHARGDVVVTIFEITIVAVLVACCVGMFQQYDAMGYMGWNGYGSCPAALPPLPAMNTADGGYVRITVDDLRRAVSREVEQKVRQEFKKEAARAQLHTVPEDSAEL